MAADNGDLHQPAARSRVEVGRGKEGRWWRVSIVVGDTRDQVDDAVAHAIEIERSLADRYIDA